MLDVVPESGITCEARADRPVAAPTADSASSTGTPAATIAPKPTSRITKVTGRLTAAADDRSLATWSFTAWFTDWSPACCTRSVGLSRWTADVVLSSGWTSASGRSVTSTTTAEPAGDLTGAATAATCDSPAILARTCAAAAAAAPGSSSPCRAVMSTSSVSGGLRCASCSQPRACPDWPVEVSRSLAWCRPAACPASTQQPTNTSHNTIARHLCVALQRASRTVRARGEGVASGFVSVTPRAFRRVVLGAGGLAPEWRWSFLYRGGRGASATMGA